jgi:transcriptional regulator GlxA family with amidase domain
MMAGVAPRCVVLVAYPGVQVLDVAGPHEVFAGAISVLAERGHAVPYSLRVVSADGGIVRSESGLALETTSLPKRSQPIDTLVLAGGNGVHRARKDERLVEWISAVAPGVRRVATVCSGTFLAAEAGLLDGRTVTTHWARAARLASEFPSLDVQPDPIFVRSDDGRVWTSAGVTAGIDLSLALVEDDHGADVAQTIARWLVMFLRRPGGQSQFAAPVWMPRAERSAIRTVQHEVDSDPAADHRVPALAARSAMSPRHFTRVFTAEVGESPGQYVERARTEAARRALEDTDDPVTAIARRCGFGTAETLRRTFVKRLGVAPDHYRRRFSTLAHDGTHDRSHDGADDCSHDSTH